MWCYPLLQPPSGPVLNLFICAPNTETYISTEMLGTKGSQHRQSRVPGHWTECRGASRVAGEEPRSHLSGFLSPGCLKDLSTRGGGGAAAAAAAAENRSAARWLWPITDGCNITSDTFLLVTDNWHTVCIRVWIIFVDTLNTFCEFKLLLSFWPTVPELWDPLNYK
jgi:hypothetical protein